MEPLILVKLIHVISSAVLFGGVLTTALVFTLAHRFAQPIVAQVAALCRMAGWVTLAALVVQPVTGFALISLMENSPVQPWLQAAYWLFALVFVGWVGQSMQLGRFAKGEAGARFALWAAFAWGSVAVMLAIFYLMLTQPALWGAKG